MALYGVWHKGYSTPVVVNASSSSEAKKKAKNKKHQTRGGAAIVKSKKLDKQDSAIARKGRWVRTRASGKKVTGRAPEASKRRK